MRSYSRREEFGASFKNDAYNYSHIILFYILYIVHTLDMFYILTLYLYGSYGTLNKIKIKIKN